MKRTLLEEELYGEAPASPEDGYKELGGDEPEPHDFRCRGSRAELG